jgi:hypothetical protein
MPNDSPTGVVFQSRLATALMVTKLRQQFPMINWLLGDSDQYRDYYVLGKRADGLRIKIMPEDEPLEYYLGVYFADMPVFPQPEDRLDIARHIHNVILPIIQGVRKD